MLKNIKGIFKKLDIVIIMVLLVLSFTPEIIFGIKYSKKPDLVYASITVAGKEYKNIPLTGNNKEEEFVVETKYGTNKVVIKGESVAILEADCPDQVCMKPGFISKPGQSLVCLPHKLMIEIVGESDDDIILSY